MKRSWIGFVLLLVLLAGGVAATWGMAKCHEPIARDLENAAKTALQGDMAQGEVLMLQAREAWGRSRHLGACFADHTPMEEIDALFAEVEVYAAAREETDFAAGCAALSRKVEAMGQAHGASWWNLFKKSCTLLPCKYLLATPAGRGGRAQEWSVSLPIRSIRCFTTTQQICAVLLFFIQRLSALRQCDDGLRQFPGGGQRLVVGVPGGTYLDQQTAGGQILVEPLAAQL